MYKSNETVGRPERKGSKQMELMEVGADMEVASSNGMLEHNSAVPQDTTDILPCFQGVDANRGIDVELHSAMDPTSKCVFSAAKDSWRNDEGSGLISECASSDLGSSHNDHAPQVLGVSHHFCPHRKSGRWKDACSIAEEPLLSHPLLGSSSSQSPSPAQKPERECSTEDMKWCYRPEPDHVSVMVDFCGKCTAQKSNGAGVQREAKGGNGRTDQACGVWVECQREQQALSACESGGDPNQRNCGRGVAAK